MIFNIYASAGFGKTMMISYYSAGFLYYDYPNHPWINSYRNNCCTSVREKLYLEIYLKYSETS